MRMPRVTIRRRIVLPRPGDSTYRRPITAWLFFAPPEHHLARATELILDFPGGGFVSMTTLSLSIQPWCRAVCRIRGYGATFSHSGLAGFFVGTVRGTYVRPVVICSRTFSV